MTIIVYDCASNMIAADTRHSWDDGMVQEGTKILRNAHYSGAYAGQCGGDVMLGLAAEALLIKPTAQIVMLEEDAARVLDGVEAFIKMTNTASVFYLRMQRRALVIVPAGSTTYAIGSGAPMFRALWAQEPPVGSLFLPNNDYIIRRVCQLVPTCGLPIEWF